MQPGTHDEADDEVEAIEALVAHSSGQPREQRRVTPVEQVHAGRLRDALAADGPDDVSQAGVWPWAIDPIVRDDVQVQMRNRLPCSDARIKTNAEALGLVKPLDLRLHDINEREEVRAFLGRCCPPVSNSATS